MTKNFLCDKQNFAPLRLFYAFAQGHASTIQKKMSRGPKAVRVARPARRNSDQAETKIEIDAQDDMYADDSPICLWWDWEPFALSADPRRDECLWPRKARRLLDKPPAASPEDPPAPMCLLLVLPEIGVWRRVVLVCRKESLRVSVVAEIAIRRDGLLSRSHRKDNCGFDQDLAWLKRALYGAEAAATRSDDDLRTSIVAWARLARQCAATNTEAILGMRGFSTGYLPDAVVDALEKSLPPPGDYFDGQFLTADDAVTMIDRVVPACTRLQCARSRTDLESLAACAVVGVLCRDLSASARVPSHLAALVAAHALVRAWDHRDRAALAAARGLLGLAPDGPTTSGASWHKPFLEAILLC
ncbi:hypothetical protein psal_cds_540 [Pandoravirus salinus]|uniref:Uncharacterized protein n=1 Tax=Pandoravirus salinus TaxID=1349410 RepID=S4VUY5_9VIRU|nr:hypothetical protein psal_cds_540 [Pandoravirus salinus]AGO84379.1 hypothetical protein psal_cds_540 [Pandoravirus salinus]